MVAANLVVVAAVLASVLASGPVDAEPGQWCSLVPASENERYGGGDPRVRVQEIAGIRVSVLVPPGYEGSSRRYPVIWLFHGGISHEDCFLTETDMIAFTADQPDDRQAILAMPDGGPGSAWFDTKDGNAQDETLFTEHLVPGIDARYRTIPDRAYRAIGGFSAGGFGASRMAVRRPDLFVALGPLAAVIEMRETDPVGASLYAHGQYWVPVFWSGAEPGTSETIGNPATDKVYWRNMDPLTLAPNYGGVAVDVYVGTGVPCDLEDQAGLVSLLPLSALETLLRRHADRFGEALRAAGVPHAINVNDCGIHTYRWWEAYFHQWWDDVHDAFGTPPPAVFDHRRIDPSFTVWDWTFTADAGRAPEFLDVSDASCAGLGLHGSGTTRVTTPPCFQPGVTVAVDGSPVVADPEGRLTFDVDLGPPHHHPQYTPVADALEAAGGYWRSRIVRFGA